MPAIPTVTKDSDDSNYESKARALALWLQGWTQGRIADSVGKSRKTINTWAKNGELTDGTPWKEYREHHQTLAIMERRAAELQSSADGRRKFLQELRDDLIGPIYSRLMAKLETGDFQATISDLDTIAKLYVNLSDDGAQAMAVIEDFMRQLAAIVFEIMDEKQFALFKVRALGLQAEFEKKLLPLGRQED